MLKGTMLKGPIWVIAILSLMFVTAQPRAALAQRSAALEKLIKAAVKEKEMRMVLGGWGPQKLWDELAKLTKATYGIDVKLTFVAGPNLSRATARGLQEYKAGQTSSTDAFLVSPRLALKLTDAGAVYRVPWRELNPKIPPIVVNDASTGLIVSGTNGGIIYNKKMLRREDMPATVEDLLDPKYKGKIVSTSVATQWSEIAVLKGEELVTRVIKGILDNGNLVGVEPGCGDKELIAVGQYAMQAFWCNMFQAENYVKETGAPLGLAFLKDAKWVAPYHWVVPKNSKAPNLAKLLGLVLATPAAQKILDKHNGRTSPYIPGGRIYEFTQEGQRSGGEDFLIDTWKVIKKHRSLYVGKTRNKWRKMFRSR